MQKPGIVGVKYQLLSSDIIHPASVQGNRIHVQCFGGFSCFYSIHFNCRILIPRILKKGTTDGHRFSRMKTIITLQFKERLLQRSLAAAPPRKNLSGLTCKLPAHNDHENTRVITDTARHCILSKNAFSTTIDELQEQTRQTYSLCAHATAPGRAERSLEDAELVFGIVGHHFRTPGRGHGQFDFGIVDAGHGGDGIASLGDNLRAGWAGGAG